MTIFDLVFLALFVVAIGTVVTAVRAAWRGRRTTASALLLRTGLAAAAYLGVVVAVSAASPGRVVALGEDQCSDDWCLAVVKATRVPSPEGVTHEVTFRISSRARRVSQRERGVVVYLRDDRGRRYDPDPRLPGVPFDALLAPLQQITTTRSFAVPADARGVGVVVAREGLAFPRCFIIGDDDSLLHAAPVVRLEPPAAPGR